MKTDENGQQIVAASQSVTYSGPLPTSKEFAGYEAALPGTAERLLAMAEKEADRRHELEAVAVNTAVKLNTRGQILGFAIAILSICAVLTSLILDRPMGLAASIFIAFISMVGMGAVFADRSKIKKK